RARAVAAAAHGSETERPALIRGSRRDRQRMRAQSTPTSRIDVNRRVRRSTDGALGTPGAGYFNLVFPQVRDEAKRMTLWRDEVKRVVAATYPNEFAFLEPPRPRKPRMVPHSLRHPTVIAAIIGLVGTLLTVLIPLWISTRRGEPPQSVK